MFLKDVIFMISCSSLSEKNIFFNKFHIQRYESNSPVPKKNTPERVDGADCADSINKNKCCCIRKKQTCNCMGYFIKKIKNCLRCRTQ